MTTSSIETSQYSERAHRMRTKTSNPDLNRITPNGQDLVLLYCAVPHSPFSSPVHHSVISVIIHVPITQPCVLYVHVCVLERVGRDRKRRSTNTDIDIQIVRERDRGKERKKE